MRATRPASALTLSAVVALLLVGAPAQAQPTPAPSAPSSPSGQAVDAGEQEAQQLFIEGREAVKKGDLAQAAAKFQRSVELRATPGTLLNLANVEEQMGKLVKALHHFEGALKLLPENDERRPVAAEGAERVRPRIPSLRIDRAAGAPADMTIRLDGSPLAASTLGAYQPMDPATYTVSTSAPGHDDRRYEVKLAESMHITLAVEPGKDLEKVRLPPPVPAAGGRVSLMQAVGAGALGVGLTGIAIGAVTGVLAIVKHGDASTGCPVATACHDQAALDAGSSGRALAGVSTASFVVGALGIGAGIGLVVGGRERSTPPLAARATFVPWALPGGGGLAASGKF
jgi:hypothetical protein